MYFLSSIDPRTGGETESIFWLKWNMYCIVNCSKTKFFLKSFYFESSSIHKIVANLFSNYFKNNLIMFNFFYLKWLIIAHKSNKICRWWSVIWRIFCRILTRSKSFSTVSDPKNIFFYHSDVPFRESFKGGLR